MKINSNIKQTKLRSFYLSRKILPAQHQNASQFTYFKISDWFLFICTTQVLLCFGFPISQSSATRSDKNIFILFLFFSFQVKNRKLFEEWFLDFSRFLNQNSFPLVYWFSTNGSYSTFVNSCNWLVTDTITFVNFFCFLDSIYKAKKNLQINFSLSFDSNKIPIHDDNKKLRKVNKWLVASPLFLDKNVC